MHVGHFYRIFVKGHQAVQGGRHRLFCSSHHHMVELVEFVPDTTAPGPEELPRGISRLSYQREAG